MSPLTLRAPLILLLAASLVLPQSSPNVPIRGFSGDEVRAERDRETQARAIPQADRIRAFARRMSAKPHAAGSPQSKAVAAYILGQLREWGLDANLESFEPLLPYPTARLLEMTAPVRWVARLHEPVVAEDKDSGEPNQLPAYNAYSATGDVTAPLVYVNYGVPEDYEYLKQQGIDVKDKIVIARYGKSWRGVKPKLAQQHGAVGCLIYSDPHEDGYFQGDVYPKGAFRPAQGVQRGSVVDMPLYPGDPLTPGWASEKGAKRLPRSEAGSLLKIPVLPISYADAKPLLSNLGGPVAPEAWRGALPFTYHVGPGSATVHLKLDFDWTSKPIFDVIARVPGSVYPDEWVIWGNHHDAWVNGASDPVSGASALLEAAHTLAEMIKRGWKPKRTIIFAFWDGEEFGLIGSTEWVEKYQAELEKKVAVYINSDSNGKGTLAAGGSHTLEQFVTEVARDINDPVSGKSLLDARKSKQPPHGGENSGAFRLTALGAGSDYVAFIDHIGASSLNLSFGGEGGGGVYHSIYDSFNWYTHFSDGDFVYGRTLAQVMAVSLMRLADASVLPYEFGSLARTVRGYADEIQKEAGAASKSVEFREVYVQLARLEGNARNYEEALAGIEKRLPQIPADKLAKVNEVLYRTERRLLSSRGLPGREWYRHELYAPGLYTGYGAKTMPGVREAVEAGRWEEANHEANHVTHALQRLNAQVEEAARLLRGLED